jgi:hypothetical protein
MSIELQLDDIQYHVNRLETLLEALQPQLMTMAAAMALSACKRAKTEIYGATIVAEFTSEGFIGTKIQDGDVVGYSALLSLEKFENWLYGQTYSLETNEKVWRPI